MSLGKASFYSLHHQKKLHFTHCITTHSFILLIVYSWLNTFCNWSIINYWLHYTRHSFIWLNVYSWLNSTPSAMEAGQITGYFTPGTALFYSLCTQQYTFCKGNTSETTLLLTAVLLQKWSVMVPAMYKCRSRSRQNFPAMYKCKSRSRQNFISLAGYSWV